MAKSSIFKVLKDFDDERQSHGRPISRQLPKEKRAKLAANRVETPAASSTDALENETRG